VVYFCIWKQKVVWILKLRKNGWEAAASTLRVGQPGRTDIDVLIHIRKGDD
jgi:hypothetical protein